MRPRIFISSTYYDLKYIRETLESFFKNYGYEPVLFESGDVPFEQGKPLDISCYNEVKTCHMMVLIVGGRYGSKASESQGKDFIKEYESQYVSITRKEFSTAKNIKMPVFIFIDKSVYAEFKTFKENRRLFYELEKKEESKDKLKFVHVDSVNVFEFISDISGTGLPIFLYEKYEEIERQLKSQFAGLFYLYLKELQDKEGEQAMINTIDELKTISEGMNQMLQKVGEKVFENDKETYKQVISNQDKILLKHLAAKLASNLTMYGGTFKSKHWKIIAQYIVNNYFENEELIQAIKVDEVAPYGKVVNDFRNHFEKNLKIFFTSLGLNDLNLYKADYIKAQEVYFNVKRHIKDNQEYRDIFLESFAKELENNCIPF